jgi:hypothetical protein
VICNMYFLKRKNLHIIKRCNKIYGNSKILHEYITIKSLSSLEVNSVLLFCSDGKIHPLTSIHHTSTYNSSLCKLMEYW